MPATTTQTLDSAMTDWNAKHHPVVPEPSTYGLVFAGLCIVLVAIKKFRSAGVHGRM